MKRLLLISLCLLLMVAPAFAQSATITAPEGQAIRFLTIGSNEDTTGTFTIYFNDDTSMDGSWSYTTTFDVLGVSLVRDGSVTVDGETASTTYRTPGMFYIKLMQTKSMFNASENAIRGAYGQIDGAWYNYVETESVSSPIISISFSADQDVTYTPEYWTLKKGNQNVGGGLLDYVNRIMEIVSLVFWTFIDFITALYEWGFFFFVDNLTMIIALFLAVPMAFAAKNSRGNPERFLRQYFRTLKGFFTFMIDIFRVLAEIIGTVRGWFRI